MALDLGTLYGKLSLDNKEWNQALDGAEQGLKDFGSKGKMIAAGAGVAIGAALAAGLVKAMDVEAANDKLAASLGLTKKQAERAGKTAGKVFANGYGASIGEVNTAVGAVMSSIKGMRNASSKDIEAMTTRVLDMATAFEIDATRAAQVAGQMINTGLAKNGVEAADLLTASLQKVPTAVREDLLDAVDEYGPFMQGLGLSGEKAMTMLVNASEKGMYGIDKTGDALKEFSIRATDMSKTTGEAYDTLGMDQEAMTTALLAGGDKGAKAFQKIVDGLLGIKDPVERSQAAIKLFGVPLEDLSVNEIPKFLGSLTQTEKGLGKVGGASEKMGKTLNDNAATNIETFRRKLTGAFVKVLGEKVIPAITKATAWLAKNLGPALKDLGNYITGTVVPALRKFSSWFMENKGTIAVFAGVITALLIPAMIRWGVTTAIAFAKMQGGAIKTAAVYVAQSYVMIASWVRMGLAAIKSGAQTAAIWALYRLEALKGAAAYVAQSLRVAAAWVAMSAAAVASGAKTKAVWLGTMVASAVKGAAKFLVSTGRVIGGWALMAVKSLFHAARMAAAWFIALGPIGWVTAAVIAIVALIIANWSKIKKWTVKIWKAVVDWVVDAWKSIKKQTLKLLTQVYDWVYDKMWALSRVVRDAFEAVTGFIKDAWKSAKKWTISIVTAIADWISDKFDGIKATTKRIWEALADIIERVWGGVKATIKRVWEGIKDTFNALKDFITKTIPGAFEKGVDKIKDFWNDLKRIAKAPIKFMIDTVYNKGIRSVFNNVMDFVGSDERLPKLKVKGFRKGGYTGDGPAHEAAGIVHKGEYVATKAQTAAAGGPKGMAALVNSVSGGVGGFNPIWGPFQNSIRNAGRLSVGTGAGGAWNIPSAASMWDRLAGLRVKAGGGQPHATTGLGQLGSILAWATGSGNITFNTQGIAPGLSPVMKTATAAHEIGHVLGLPHTNGASIMQPTIGKYMVPTSMDKKRLESLYGAGSRAPGEGSFNPLSWLIDNGMKLLTGFLEKIPGSGAFVTMASEIAKSVVSSIKDWALTAIGGEDPRDKGTSTGMNKFGATLYDNGGWLNTGPSLVENKTGKPEAVLTSEDYKLLKSAALSDGITYSPTYQYMGEDPEQVARRDRRRLMDTLAAHGI